MVRLIAIIEGQWVPVLINPAHVLCITPWATTAERNATCLIRMDQSKTKEDAAFVIAAHIDELAKVFCNDYTGKPS